MEAHRESQAVANEVGVRELRQNLSVYLDRVKAGEELTVTERGVPVARLTQLPKRSALQQMIDAGLVDMPSNPGGWRDIKPLVIPGLSLSKILLEMRESERF